MKEIFWHNQKFFVLNSDLKRFHEKYKIDSATGCWNWTASKKQDGYPQFYTTDVNWRGHVFAFLALKQNKFSHGMNMVCHTCDNILCVNPDHLFEGNSSINQKDCRDKGRFPSQKGEGNHCAVLTDDIVREIRAMRTQGDSAAYIYWYFSNINPSTIRNIIYNPNYWSHVK